MPCVWKGLHYKNLFCCGVFVDLYNLPTSVWRTWHPLEHRNACGNRDYFKFVKWSMWFVRDPALWRNTVCLSFTRRPHLHVLLCVCVALFGNCWKIRGREHAHIYIYVLDCKQHYFMPMFNHRKKQLVCCMYVSCASSQNQHPKRVFGRQSLFCLDILPKYFVLGCSTWKRLWTVNPKQQRYDLDRLACFLQFRHVHIDVVQNGPIWSTGDWSNCLWLVNV